MRHEKSIECLSIYVMYIHQTQMPGGVAYRHTSAVEADMDVLVAASPIDGTGPRHSILKGVTVTLTVDGPGSTLCRKAATLPPRHAAAVAGRAGGGGGGRPPADGPAGNINHDCNLKPTTPPPADTLPLSRDEMEVLVAEAGGHLLTDLPAAVAAAERKAAAAAPPPPSVYVLSTGTDTAEVVDLAVRISGYL